MQRYPRNCLNILGLFSLFIAPAYASDDLPKHLQDDQQWTHPRKDYANTGWGIGFVAGRD